MKEKAQPSVIKYNLKTNRYYFWKKIYQIWKKVLMRILSVGKAVLIHSWILGRRVYRYNLSGKQFGDCVSRSLQLCMFFDPLVPFLEAE